MSRPRVEPPDDTKSFWDATRDRWLVIPWCVDCTKSFWFPRAVCPRCLGSNLEYRASAGLGTVYAVSVHHGEEPYAVALVDIAEGVRMMSNIVGPGALEARVGDAVRVAWEPLSDGRNLPVFELEERQ